MTGLDGRKLGVLAALIAAAACSGGAMNGATTTGAGAGATTTTKTTTHHTTTVASTGTGGTTGAGGMGGMGGSAPVCNPPAAAGSFYATSAYQYGNPGPTSMCDYRGDVILVVNTADV